MDYKETARKIIEEYISNRPIQGGDEDFTDMTVSFGEGVKKDINGTLFDISIKASADIYNYREATYNSPVEYNVGEYDIFAEVGVYNKYADELEYFILEFYY